MRVRRRQASEKKREDYFRALVAEGVRPPIKPQELITRKAVETVLAGIDRATPDLIDVVLALLDSQFPNLFDSDLPLSAGAATADIACYVGIFVRHRNKLDREGRDYWIKPLRDVGIIEPVTFTKDKGFIEGHLTAKSPSSAYRLNKDFINLLINHTNTEIKHYFAHNKVAQRLMVQSQAVEYSASNHGRGDHHNLIELASTIYAAKFLPTFKVIYKDNADGARISDEEKENFREYGITLNLSDAFPDLILADNNNQLWFIEAVTSDGEVDEQKFNLLQKFCIRNNKKLAGATTCYLNWKSASVRQEKFKNICSNTYLWIASDPSKHFLSNSFL